MAAVLVGSMFAAESFAASKAKERICIEITNADNPLYTPGFYYTGDNIKPKCRVTYFDSKNKQTVLSKDQYEISGDTSRKKCGKYLLIAKGNRKWFKHWMFLNNDNSHGGFTKSFMAAVVSICLGICMEYYEEVLLSLLLTTIR